MSKRTTILRCLMLGLSVASLACDSGSLEREQLNAERAWLESFQPAELEMKLEEIETELDELRAEADGFSRENVEDLLLACGALPSGYRTTPPPTSSLLRQSTHTWTLELQNALTRSCIRQSVAAAPYHAQVQQLTEGDASVTLYLWHTSIRPERDVPYEPKVTARPSHKNDALRAEVEALRQTIGGMAARYQRRREELSAFRAIAQAATTPEPQPSRTPAVDLSALPDWSGSLDTGDAPDDTVVHAVDAAGDVLAVHLGRRTDGNMILPVPAAPTLVTGRTTLHSEKQLAGLASAYPQLATLGRVNAPIVGSGRRVSLQFSHVDGEVLLRLLSDVSGVDYVARPDDIPRTSIRVRNVPWDGLMTELVRRWGMEVHNLGGVRLVVRAGQKPALFEEAGSRVRLRAWEARPGVVASLLDASLGYACDAGEPVTLQLGNASPAQIHAALELLSDAAPRGAGTCQIDDITDLEAFDPEDLTLAATVTNDATPQAIVRTADGHLYRVQRDMLSVRPGGDVFKIVRVSTERVVVEKEEPSGRVTEYDVDPPLSAYAPRDRPDPRVLRLAATFVSPHAGYERGAVFEANEDWYYFAIPFDGTYAQAPGHLEIAKVEPGRAELLETVRLDSGRIATRRWRYELTPRR